MQRVLKAAEPLNIPSHLHKAISFVSFNHMTSGLDFKDNRYIKDETESRLIISHSSVVGKQHEEENQALRPPQKSSKAHRGCRGTELLSETGIDETGIPHIKNITAYYAVSKSTTIGLYVRCPDGKIDYASPPCGGNLLFQVQVLTYYSLNGDVYHYETQQTTFDVSPDRVYCRTTDDNAPETLTSAANVDSWSNSFPSIPTSLSLSIWYKCKKSI